MLRRCARAGRRWATTGKEQAAKAKAERDKRTHVEYKQHLSDLDVDRQGGGMSDEEFVQKLRSMKVSDLADEKGAVDFWEYARLKVAGRLGMGFHDGYRLSQKESVHYQKHKRKMRDFQQNVKDEHTRWEPGHERVSGFRVTGGKKRIETKKQEDAAKEEVEEKVVTRLPNPYKTLALPPHASAKHAADNYKKLAKKYHPDAPGGDDKKMAELNAAYELVKKIIKEGGPAKSTTAAECSHEETIHTVKSKRKAYRTEEEVKADDEEEFIFQMNPRLRAEREEMRRMAYEYKSSARAAKRREDARAERRASALEGGFRPMTNSEAAMRTFKITGCVCSAILLFIFASLPRDSIQAPRVTNYAAGNPCPSR
eukprot:TRINITY_DN15779_c0_g1_i1.p1 TRINITY_DN15779_c0_g1~~TRINITY_DN15779_c0_g1_i1.p1  ORF type:complete len:369 (+),score=88.44 TRINITY_DN15779_c0_g1_i1:16-1122(+)